MTHFCDIRVIKNPEMSFSHVMNSVFSLLHLVLAQKGYQDVGISFPLFNDKGLGNCLRLHGLETRLQELLSSPFWNGIRDYINLSRLERTPENTKYRQVFRVQSKSNAERLRRRLIARKGVTQEEAKEKIPDSIEKNLNLPYLSLFSKSSGQNFRLFLKHGPLLEKSKHGLFNSYGLSIGGSIPWF